MRSLFKFILRNYFVFLFLFLEGVSFIFIFQHNAFQKSQFIENTRSVTSFIYKNLYNLREYFHLREENDILSAENSRLRNLLEKQHPEEPAAILVSDTVRRINYEYIPARVIYNSVNKQYNYITLDKGKSRGVYDEMAVISDRGVVGIVSGTSNNFASVLPILNRNFRLSAKIKRNNYFGIIEWDGLSTDVVALKEIPVHIDIQKGDTIVTSGYSAIFPEGINVGVVKSVTPTDGNFHEVYVQLSTNYLNLVHVYLIHSYHREERDSLEKGEGLW
jgi:rod shape-determining protein MreC